jgi:hypothetical protein
MPQTLHQSWADEDEAGEPEMSNDDLRSPPGGIEWVELKVTLDRTRVDDGLRALDLDPDGAAAEPREIYFCERVDPPSDPVVLPLLARGVILRIRKIQHGPGDSTLKLRGPEGSVDPELWHRRTQAFGGDAKIEGDWAADRRLVSASLGSKVEGGRIDEVVADRPRQLRRLLSKAQERLAADLLLGLDELELLDPIHARKWEGAGRLGEEVAAELWELDDGLRFLELSMRVNINQSNPVQAKQRFEDSVRDCGLTIDANQETKTRTVLERLVKAAAAGRAETPRRRSRHSTSPSLA